MDFYDILKQSRLISIIRGVDSPEQLELALEAVYAGGIRLAEITFDSTGKRSDDITAEWIGKAVRTMEGKMLIGAGTVLNANQVELTKRAGGGFIISPDMNPDVIRKTKEEGLISIPAAMTVSEIIAADRFGADYIKIFPANAVGGSDFFRAIAGPLPGLRLLAVSGVTPDNAEEYLKAGAYGFGIGSGIVNASLCKDGDYKSIEQNARRFFCACAGK